MGDKMVIAVAVGMVILSGCGNLRGPTGPQGPPGPSGTARGLLLLTFNITRTDYIYVGGMPSVVIVDPRISPERVVGIYVRLVSDGVAVYMQIASDSGSETVIVIADGGLFITDPEHAFKGETIVVAVLP